MKILGYIILCSVYIMLLAHGGKIVWLLFRFNECIWGNLDKTLITSFGLTVYRLALTNNADDSKTVLARFNVSTCCCAGRFAAKATVFSPRGVIKLASFKTFNKKIGACYS